jgi:hypothetical protein
MVEPSVLDELVFIGRSGPVIWVAEPVDEDYRYCPALAPDTVADSVPSKPSVCELVARAVVLAFLAASMVLIIALAIGYAAR